MKRDRNISTTPFSALLWGSLVVVVVAWCGYEVWGFEFVVWDDELKILVNPHVGQPTAENLAWMFTDSSYMRRYVPFGWIGFSIAYAFSGVSAPATLEIFFFT